MGKWERGDGEKYIEKQFFCFRFARVVFTRRIRWSKWSNNWYTQMAGTLFHSARKKGVLHVRVRYNICIIIYLL